MLTIFKRDCRLAVPEMAVVLQTDITNEEAAIEELDSPEAFDMALQYAVDNGLGGAEKTDGPNIFAVTQDEKVIPPPPKKDEPEPLVKLVPWRWRCSFLFTAKPAHPVHAAKTAHPLAAHASHKTPVHATHKPAKED